MSASGAKPQVASCCARVSKNQATVVQVTIAKNEQQPTLAGSALQRYVQRRQQPEINSRLGSVATVKWRDTMAGAWRS